MTRVLVTGSRAWTDIRAVVAALDRVLAEHGGRMVVVHGACRSGADAIANEWARRRGVPVERWPADWAALRNRAGMERNTAMVGSRPDLCLAFIRDNSPGATHCAGAAEAAGIPTRLYLAGGEGEVRRPGRVGRGRSPGWRMPAGAVYVGRPSRWGNPYRHDGTAAGRAAVVEAYRQRLADDAGLLAAVRAELAGRVLVCWCPPDQPCHADVLLDAANGSDIGGGAR